MTPEEFDIDFDFDKEYGFHNDPGKKSPEPDDFDLDAALARELGPDFDALFEKEYAATQAALSAELAAEAEAARTTAAEDMTQTRMFRSFADLDAEDEEALQTVPTVPVSEIPAEEPAADPEPEEEPAPRPLRERRPAKKGLDLSAITEKVDLKGVGEKVSGVGVVLADNGKRFAAAVKEIKPGKMDKKQKRRFKDDVLPVLLAGATFLMCLVFIVGALSRGLNSEERQEAARLESIAAAEAEAAAQAEIRNTLDTAAAQAAGYDYQAAINTLDGYKNPETGRELTEEMAAARAEYAAALADLVIWDDPAAIANLSFHTLVVDPVRSYADPGYSNSYRNKFITAKEFSAILEQLYEAGYVLVNLDSCISESTDSMGNVTYTTKPIYLPQGKTPIMITETLVNYFAYMIDGNGDGTADAEGAGFASRLVLDGDRIKAEYVDADGNQLTGDYDLVPILDTFIEAHPDFSYRGAKAILAVTGSEGVFGWRTNTGDAAELSGAKAVVEALRADGYQIASNSYGNLDYSGSTTGAQITADLTTWAAEVTPVLGEVDIMVIAKGGGIKAGGTGFQLMQEAGFAYILDSTDAVGGELTSNYFHQHRLMVVGSDLTSGIYDAYFDGTAVQDAAR